MLPESDRRVDLALGNRLAFIENRGFPNRVWGMSDGRIVASLDGQSMSHGARRRRELTYSRITLEGIIPENWESP